MSRDVERFRHFLKAGMPGPHAYVVLLGLTRFDFPGVIENIEKGLPYSAFERLQRNTAFSTDQLLDLLQIPRRTLARGRLPADFQQRSPTDWCAWHASMPGLFISSMGIRERLPSG